jgi:competence protein ComEC
MIRWIPYTFIRTVIFFIGGILLGVSLPGVLPLGYAIPLLFTSVVLYGVIYFAGIRKLISFINPGLIALPGVFLAGYVHLLIQTESTEQAHLSSFTGAIEAYQVTLIGYTEEKEQSWKVTGEVMKIKELDLWKEAHGKVIVYFPKRHFKAPFSYGDVLLVKGSPGAIEPVGNPGEFDYKRFLNYKNIYHQHFIRDDKVLLLERSTPNVLVRHALIARTWANGVLHRHIAGAREQAVASALVLGVTDGLDDELLKAYSGSGAMHVLAVSGLHISIIYLIIAVLLKPFAKMKRGPWIVAATSLAILWAYAFVTGLSPSVLRAVTMFTFIAIAKATSRHSNIYNTLAASAFCLLLFDPYLIMSVGFQLSYLAVIGIIYVHPLLYNVWEPDSWVVNEVWKVTSVSIAAQIATFPLGLLYFHQFPNYFLLSNVLVIPLSFVILVLGVAILAVSFIPPVAALTGMVLQFCIWILNGSVILIESLPMSVIENIRITGLQTLMLSLFVASFLLMLQYKKYRYFKYAFTFALLFASLQWNYFNWHAAADKMIVYKIKGHSAIDIFEEAIVYHFADSMLSTGDSNVRYHIRPNRTEMRANLVQRGDELPVSRKIEGGKLIVWKNKVILHITNDIFTPREIGRVNVLIISNDAVADLDKINTVCRGAIVVFDGTNSFKYVDRMLAGSRGLGLRAHSVLHQGAFEYLITANS